MTKNTLFARCAKAAVASLCLIVSTGSVADSVDSGRHLIGKMSLATQELNYSGSFVYSHGGELETMRIFHSNTNGIERERLLALNGEAREIIRDEESVVCIWPGTKTVAVSSVTPRTPFPEFEPDQIAQLEKLYSFDHLGMDRVAGRAVEVVDIKPLDEFRYGYRLWIDAETYLMLRSMMSDQRGAVIEQVMFTEIEYKEELSPNLFRASLEGEQQEWMADLDKPLIRKEPDTDIPGLDGLSMPDGFEMMSDKVVMLPEDSVVRRIMYTDGLASLSIYVAAAGSEAQHELQGLSGMGAVHAYGVVRDKWHVTVVGEVPQPTVVMMGDSLKLAQR